MIKFITESTEYLQSKGFDKPEVGIILGTGLGQLINEIEIIAEASYNHAGAINLDFKKGELMLIDDHINLQGGSPLAFKGVSDLGERFTDMSAPYDAEINTKLKNIAKKHNITLHKGVYASVVGPQLETRAEYRMLKIIGADAVGMSTVPEIIVANHLNLKAAAVSVLTDECDPDNLKPVNITEIIAMASKAEPNMITLFKELIKTI